MNLKPLIDKRDEFVKILWGQLDYLAEDCVQEAYRRALSYSDSFDPDRGDVEKWFSSILYTCKMEFLRDDGMSRDVEVDDNTLVDELSDVMALPINEYVEGLRGDDQEIMRLVWLKGYETPQVVEVLPFTTNQVKKMRVKHNRMFVDWYWQQENK